MMVTFTVMIVMIGLLPRLAQCTGQLIVARVCRRWGKDGQ